MVRNNLVKPIFKKCPNCGSARIKYAQGDYTTTAHGKPLVIPNVPRHECPVCGEVFLDYDAVKRIESFRLSGKKPGKWDARRRGIAAKAGSRTLS